MKRTQRVFRHWRTSALLGFLDLTSGPLTRAVLGPLREAALAEVKERARIAEVASAIWRWN